MNVAIDENSVCYPREDENLVKRVKFNGDEGSEPQEPAGEVELLEGTRQLIGDGWKREVVCGVSSFVVKDQIPLNCTFKHRFSDFLVNEISSSGRVVHLTSIEVEKATEVSSLPDEFLEEADGNFDVVEMIEKAGERYDAIVRGTWLENDEGVRKGFLEFLESVYGMGHSDTTDESAVAVEVKQFSFPTGSSKEWRRTFHESIKLLKGIQSKTIKIDDENHIKIWYDAGEAVKMGGRTRKKVGIHENRYLRLVLYKVNRDSSSVFNLMSKFLCIPHNSIRFAGTKDKRGVTVQQITIPWVDPRRVCAINDRLFKVKVGNFECTETPITLGQLKGNKFRVILRRVSLSTGDNSVTDGGNFAGNGGKEGSSDTNLSQLIEKEISRISGMLEDRTFGGPILGEDPFKNYLLMRCQLVGEMGFINYFGQQRFGTSDIRTFEIGRACLKGDFKNAVQLILSPRVSEKSEVFKARKYYEETKDANGTLQRLPKAMIIERKILSVLKDHPNDYLGALNHIPRMMRLMYAHSYQSYVWNAAVSFRFERYKNAVVEGDLVWINKESEEHDPKEEDVDYLLATDGESGSCIFKDDRISNNKSCVISKKNLNDNIKIIGSEEVDRYGIEDVVLPLPGPDVILPKNEVGEYIGHLLEIDGLDMCFSKDKEFHLKGDYRKLIVKPRDYEYRVFDYEDDDVDLIETDLDVIMRRKREKTMENNDATEAGSCLAGDGDGSCEGGPLLNFNGCKVALELTFSLSSSSYASCLVRELVRQPLDQAFLRARS